MTKKTHHLKTIEPYFSQVAQKEKLFELRKNDRGFEVGDNVILDEYDPENDTYSGLAIIGIISYVLENFKGLEPGYCVFGIEIFAIKRV